MSSSVRTTRSSRSRRWLSALVCGGVTALGCALFETRDVVEPDPDDDVPVECQFSDAQLPEEVLTWYEQMFACAGQGGGIFTSIHDEAFTFTSTDPDVPGEFGKTALENLFNQRMNELDGFEPELVITEDEIEEPGGGVTIFRNATYTLTFTREGEDDIVFGGQADITVVEEAAGSGHLMTGWADRELAQNTLGDFWERGFGSE